MYVHSLHLENIKAFDRLDLEFSRPGSDSDTPIYAGLNVFVGGNASGKSTLLKCIAMALSGPTVTHQLLISTDGWVRYGEQKGSIELKIQNDASHDDYSGALSPSERSVFHAALEIESLMSASVLRHIPTISKFLAAAGGLWNPDMSGWMLSAYGPLRRLTGSSSEAAQYARNRGKLASCITLFREDAALSESETWIKQEYARALEQRSLNQTASSLVEDVCEFLNDGLLPDGFQISRVTVDHVYMQTPNGGELPMRDLSDGCRSAFALMLDIIHNMTFAYPGQPLFERNAQNRFIVNKPGVVLIDEIEAHLHPSWQRLICEWLKTRFPHVQFFLTTHSPLIAQAADEGGIYVLPLPGEIASGQKVRRLQPHEQQRVAFGSADKVLLGEAFGLKHTWSQRDVADYFLNGPGRAQEPFRSALVAAGETVP